MPQHAAKAVAKASESSSSEESSDEEEEEEEDNTKKKPVQVGLQLWLYRERASKEFGS